jgi:hypothetical protein
MDPSRSKGTADARVVVTDVADGAILLDEATGTFYHVNPTGALVYALLRAGDRSVADIARALAAVFGSDDAATFADVRAFAEELDREHLVEP